MLADYIGVCREGVGIQTSTVLGTKVVNISVCYTVC